MEIIRIVRRGAKNTRVAYADGSTGLVKSDDIRIQEFLSSFRPTTFGFEFEFIIPDEQIENLVKGLKRITGGKFVDERYRYGRSKLDKWVLGRDSSLNTPNTGHSCFELNTRVLGRTDFPELKEVLGLINSLGGYVNYSCGTHVHFGFGSETVRSKIHQNLSYLHDTYGRFEDELFDKLVPESRRGSNNTYCMSNKTDTGTRRHKLNTRSWSKIRTLEVRQHSGTLNFDKITDWANLISDWINYVIVNKNGNYVGIDPTSNTIELLTTVVKSEELVNRLLQRITNLWG